MMMRHLVLVVFVTSYTLSTLSLNSNERFPVSLQHPDWLPLHVASQTAKNKDVIN
jgi:hypothetical protein